MHVTVQSATYRTVNHIDLLSGPACASISWNIPHRYFRIGPVWICYRLSRWIAWKSWRWVKRVPGRDDASLLQLLTVSRVRGPGSRAMAGETWEMSAWNWNSIEIEIGKNCGNAKIANSLHINFFKTAARPAGCRTIEILLTSLLGVRRACWLFQYREDRYHRHRQPEADTGHIKPAINQQQTRRTRNRTMNGTYIACILSRTL